VNGALAKVIAFYNFRFNKITTLKLKMNAKKKACNDITIQPKTI